MKWSALLSDAMNCDVLKDTFFELVAPDLPNDWDVEEAVEKLEDLDEKQCRTVLDQVPVIWPVSHSLCFDYLKSAGPALTCLGSSSLHDWVNSSLDQYEKNGLRAAQRYMTDVEKNFLCRIRGENGLQFNEVKGRLLPYLRGLSGRDLDLAVAEHVYTDTATVYVPSRIDLFRDDADNFFLYKLIVSYQWAFIALASFTVQPDLKQTGDRCDEEGKELLLHSFLKSFSSPELAGDLYHFLETCRVTKFLERELPGLMRRKRELFSLPENRKKIFHPTGSILQNLQGVLYGMRKENLAREDEFPLQDTFPLQDIFSLWDTVENHCNNSLSGHDSVQATTLLYPLLSKRYPEYVPVVPLLYQGHLHLNAVLRARADRLNELKNNFIDALSTRLMTMASRQKPMEEKDREEVGAGTDTGKEPQAIIVESRVATAAEDAEQTVLITLDNEEVDLGPELQEIASDIVHELGYLPERYVSSAAGKAGRGYSAFRGPAAEEGVELITPHVYNEWDYRRSDFRKKWVSVIEKDIPHTHSNFVQETLSKYHGQVVRLRYQFEMMRSTERFVRRQRDGEDIDLDALVESLADTRAGLSPSDRLFVRLKRDERDIAVLFLIDMSNSTQGWVGKAIKEALVLLCEALEVLGDRYGIYGFSGMRRLRSEFFHIKHLDEPYNDRVKQRISSIAPREYTRMGPAIRHAVSLLQDVDARARLLITLTDGKPEDYDDYKGEYAIEDTRHALMEAKIAGIHPFCITIDRQAHDYMAHMYGGVNYIMIDDVRKLPRKMPEIYRVLTG